MGCTSCTLGTNYQPQTGKASCNPLKVCNAGQYVTVLPTIVSNRQCADCGLGAVSNGNNVNQCTACDGVTTYSDETTGTSCKPIVVCVAGEKEITMPTAENNRECKQALWVPCAVACCPTFCDGWWSERGGVRKQRSFTLCSHHG